MDKNCLTKRFEALGKSLEATIKEYGSENVDFAFWVQTPDGATVVTTQETLDDVIATLVQLDCEEVH